MSRTTFIRVIETWVPSEDGSLLEFGGGYFGNAMRLQAATERLCFGKGEGLPGQVWEQGAPIVLKDLEHSYFRRGAAARADGLSCGIAIPIFQGREFRAVVVMFCGDDAAHAGAIELWKCPAGAVDMRLVDGYYGSTGDTFEFISRATAFRRGTGLPGMAWEAAQPVFLPDLGKGSGFLRADGAVKVGINRGFAIPCHTPANADFVVTFLSALATPIARKVEVWESPQPGATPLLRYGFSEQSGLLSAGVAAEAGSPVAQATASGLPVCTGATLAIPMRPADGPATVLALHFD